MDKEVYMIFDRETGDRQGAYSRAYHTEYEFDRAIKARTSNVHGIYEDKDRYRVAKYKVTYDLVDPDVDDVND